MTTDDPTSGPAPQTTSGDGTAPVPDGDREWYSVGMDERGRIHFLPDDPHTTASCCTDAEAFEWVADVRGEFLRAVTVYGVCVECVDTRFGGEESEPVHHRGFKFEFA